MIIKSLKMAFVAFYANKARTSLAILGVMIGIASIIIVFAAGEGVRGLIVEQIEAFGADAIQTELKVPSSKTGVASEQQSATSLIQGAQITTMKLDDLEDITRLPNIRDGYGAIMIQDKVVYEDEIRRTLFLAPTANFIDIDMSEVEYGRFFSESEDKSLAQVVVLGKSIKEKLFGESDPIGRSIKIRNLRFKVIGVMGERGAVIGMDFDELIYMPVRTMQKKIMGVDYIHYMLHAVYDVSMVQETAEEMRALLRDNHDISQPTKEREGWADTGKDDFRVMPMTEVMEVFDSITGTLTLLVLAIAAISLLVGGVSVMNVMYVIVNERVPEIGLRKAIGANYSDIMWQFLAESVLITSFGGIAGIIFYQQVVPDRAEPRRARASACG